MERRHVHLALARPVELAEEDPLPGAERELPVAQGHEHLRAHQRRPHVLVPLDDGKLALGRWQGIFFCEFDGPRERKIYVTTLH